MSVPFQVRAVIFMRMKVMNEGILAGFAESSLKRKRGVKGALTCHKVTFLIFIHQSTKLGER